VISARIPISGAKNAALPLMIASLLTDDTLTLENVPHLADVEQLIRILGNHGVDYSVNGRRESAGLDLFAHHPFHRRTIVDTTAPYELVSKMRASFWVIGPLLARMGEAKVSLPGGCAIGTRPVDLFIDGLRRWAPKSTSKAAMSWQGLRRRPVGNRYVFPKVSVGATHVLMMAASLAKGETVLENAAREPEVVNLAELPERHGREDHRRRHADDHHRGRGRRLRRRHRVMPDRIETGTYAMAVR
jgi:UDP-N-acetylglucosamine 1-carboxyvinyltransferase